MVTRQPIREREAVYGAGRRRGNTGSLAEPLLNGGRCAAGKSRRRGGQRRGHNSSLKGGKAEPEAGGFVCVGFFVLLSVIFFLVGVSRSFLLSREL